MGRLARRLADPVEGLGVLVGADGQGGCKVFKAMGRRRLRRIGKAQGEAAQAPAPPSGASAMLSAKAENAS